MDRRSFLQAGLLTAGIAVPAASHNTVKYLKLKFKLY